MAMVKLHFKGKKITLITLYIKTIGTLPNFLAQFGFRTATNFSSILGILNRVIKVVW